MIDGSIFVSSYTSSSESTKGDKKLFLDGGDIHKVRKLGAPLAFTMPGGIPCVDQLSQSSFFSFFWASLI